MKKKEIQIEDLKFKNNFKEENNDEMGQEKTADSLEIYEKTNILDDFPSEDIE